MSLYYYFYQLKKDVPNSEASVGKLEEGDLGESLAKLITDPNSLDHFQYESVYVDEKNHVTGDITRHVYEMAKRVMTEDRFATLINLLGRPSLESLYGMEQPFICLYTKVEVSNMLAELRQNKQLLSSKYLDLYLQILEKAKATECGIAILAF